MWQQLKPHLDMLISRFVFPCMCLTTEELEQFEEDPVEYCRGHFGGRPAFSAGESIIAEYCV
jgi:hypothetical protein